jgi:SpoVK/Ycf46/Vps4 family AAA+-type ATPase
VIDGARLSAATLPVWRRELAWHDATAVVLDAERAEPAALRTLAVRAPRSLFATCVAPAVETLLLPGRPLRTIEVDPLSSRDRVAIWRSALARSTIAADAIDLDQIAARFPFAPGRIAGAVASLEASREVPTTERVAALCRSIPDLRVGGLAARVVTPYRWDDLVVPAAVKAELELIEVWGRRSAALFAADAVGGRVRAPRGLACLFHGAPGTGKTLAAHVIANELGLDLYRVDLAQVVDKYIGETEKRLDLLFREAESAGVVLFLDEADALFAQRTDVREARDRYANLETGFLLQRLEDHSGITILATNLQKNLDGAFLRRLATVVELPLPGALERRRIWQKLLPAPELHDPDVHLDVLARRFAIAGGDIRNAIFFAVLLAERHAERLGMKHLAIGIWREMTKAGRLFDPTDLGRWQSVIASYVGAPSRP